MLPSVLKAKDAFSRGGPLKFWVPWCSSSNSALLLLLVLYVRHGGKVERGKKRRLSRLPASPPPPWPGGSTLTPRRERERLREPGGFQRRTGEEIAVQEAEPFPQQSDETAFFHNSSDKEQERGRKERLVVEIESARPPQGRMYIQRI